MMNNTSEQIKTIDEMIAYFAICNSNASASSEARKTFMNYIATLNEVRRILIREEDDGK